MGHTGLIGLRPIKKVGPEKFMEEGAPQVGKYAAITGPADRVGRIGRPSPQPEGVAAPQGRPVIPYQGRHKRDRPPRPPEPARRNRQPRPDPRTATGAYRGRVHRVRPVAIIPVRCAREPAPLGARATEVVTLPPLTRRRLHLILPSISRTPRIPGAGSPPS